MKGKEYGTSYTCHHVHEFEVEEYHPKGVIWRSAEGLLIGTLSSQDGNAEEDLD